VLSTMAKQEARHLDEGEQQVARQREIVAELERAGHDGKASRELLREFEQTLAMHVVDRDLLRSSLAASEHPCTAFSCFVSGKSNAGEIRARFGS
jgi:hypothetical protein